VPTYQYVCTQCHEPLEAVQSFSDAALTQCPVCSGRLRKVFSAVGVVFKGSGFYKTDSRAASGSGSGESSSGGDKAASKPSDSGSKGDSGKGDSGGSGKKDSAPAAGSSSSTSGSSSSTSGSSGSSAPAAKGA